MENVFNFPLTTEYHPSGVVVEEHSALREGWLGEQTATLPVLVASFSGSFPDVKWCLSYRPAGQTAIAFSLVGGQSGSGWWYHNNAFAATGRSYGYLQVEQVNNLELSGRTGDYTTTGRLFIALRTDGRLDVIKEGVSGITYGITEPAAPTLTDNHTYTTEQQVEWEEAFLVAVAVPKSPIPSVIRSPASNMVRILRNPTANTVLNISLTHPNASTVDFFVYLFKGGQAFFVGTYTNTFTQITIPPNDVLFLRGVNFRFFASNKDMFEANGEKIRGILSLGNRMVYWGDRGVYISAKNFPFAFGTEEGYTPQDGDGGFVALPNILFCVALGSTIVAVAQNKTFRIVEAGQGVWIPIEAQFSPPLLNQNGEATHRFNIYRTTVGFVDLSQGEEQVFGQRFRLLDTEQIVGVKELGMALTNSNDVYVWNGDDIYKLFNETADFIFASDGKFYLVSGGSGLTIKRWEPIGWSTVGNPKPTTWIYNKSFPFETYLERLLIQVYGISGSLPCTIYVRNFDNLTEMVSTTATLRAGSNVIYLPRRLRASVFQIEVQMGQTGGTRDYRAQIAAEVRHLERRRGGSKRL